MIWISTSALVFSASLLLRVLVMARFQRKVVPSWLTLTLVGATILAATCLLAAALPSGSGSG